MTQISSFSNNYVMCSLRCEVSQHFHIFVSIYNLQILFYMGHWKTGLSHLWPELKLLQEAKSEKLWSIGGAVWRKVQLIGRSDHFHSAHTISFVNDTVIKTSTTAWSFAYERGLLRFRVLISCVPWQWGGALSLLRHLHGHLVDRQLLVVLLDVLAGLADCSTVQHCADL